MAGRGGKNSRRLDLVGAVIEVLEERRLLSEPAIVMIAAGGFGASLSPPILVASVAFPGEVPNFSKPSRPYLNNYSTTAIGFVDVPLDRLFVEQRYYGNGLSNYAGLPEAPTFVYDIGWSANSPASPNWQPPGLFSGPSSGSITFKDGETVLGTMDLDSSGQARFVATNPFSVGLHTITASYSGSDELGPNDASLELNIEKATTDIKLDFPMERMVAGMPAMLEATLSSIGSSFYVPTGKIRFYDVTKRATLVAEAPVGGPSSMTDMISAMKNMMKVSLPAGTHYLRAYYLGDDKFMPSVSADLEYDTDCPIKDGKFTADIKLETWGPRSKTNPPVITARMFTPAGDSIGYLFEPPTIPGKYQSASAKVHVNVWDDVLSGVGLWSVIGPYHQPPVPTGRITLLENGKVIGRGELDETTCSVVFRPRKMAMGVHIVTAVYPGDDLYHGRTSKPMKVTVGLSPSYTELESSATTIVDGGKFTLTPSVYSSYPETVGLTGSVSILLGKRQVAKVELGKEMTLDLNLRPGKYDFVAVYSGDKNYLGSRSLPWTITVVPKSRQKTAR